MIASHRGMLFQSNNSMITQYMSIPSKKVISTFLPISLITEYDEKHSKKAHPGNDFYR